MSEDATGTRPTPWPSELRVQDNGRVLKVTFDDGVVGSVSSRRLRYANPDAEIDVGAPATVRDVAILSIEQIGESAVRIGFDDGYDSGVYTWRLLRALTTH